MFGKKKSSLVKEAMADSDDIDIGLDLDFMDDFEDFDDHDAMEGDFNSNKSDRTPAMNATLDVAKGVSDGILNKNAMGGLLKSILPSSYGKFADDLGNAKNELGFTISESMEGLNQVKKQSQFLLRKAIPIADKYGLNKLSALMNKAGGHDDEMGGDEAHSKGAQREQQIQDTLGSLFSLQNKIQEQKEVIQEKKNLAKEAIETTRFEGQFKVLASMDSSLKQQMLFTNRNTFNYYRKSIELQIRQLHLLADIYQNQSESNVTLLKATNDIKLNTGLPDYVKMQNMEIGKNEMKKRFFNSSADYLSNFTKSIGEYFKDSVGSFQSLTEELFEGLEMAVDMENDADEFMTEGKSATRRATSMASQTLLGGFGKKLGQFMRRNMRGTTWGNKILDGGVKLGRLRENMGPELIKALKSGKPEEFILKIFGNKDKVTGLRSENQVTAALGWAMQWMLGHAENALERDSRLNFNQGGGYGDFSTKNGQKDLMARSTNIIIPGYLARILREISSMRTGKEQELIEFNHKTGRFQKSSALAKDLMLDSLAGTNVHAFKRQGLDIIEEMKLHSTDALGRNVYDKGISEKDTEVIGRVLALMGGNVTYDTLIDRRTWAPYFSEQKVELLVKNFKALSDKDFEEGTEKISRIVSSSNDLGKNLNPDFDLIKAAVDAGQADLLIQHGIIGADMTLDKERFLNNVAKHGVGETRRVASWTDAYGNEQKFRTSSGKAKDVKRKYLKQFGHVNLNNRRANQLGLFDPDDNPHITGKNANKQPMQMGLFDEPQTVEDLKKMGSFSSGGWTGEGAKDELAGVVHKEEYVLNKENVEAMGGKSGVERLIAAFRNMVNRSTTKVNELTESITSSTEENKKEGGGNLAMIARNTEMTTLYLKNLLNRMETMVALQMNNQVTSQDPESPEGRRWYQWGGQWLQRFRRDNLQTSNDPKNEKKSLMRRAFGLGWTVSTWPIKTMFSATAWTAKKMFQSARWTYRKAFGIKDETPTEEGGEQSGFQKLKDKLSDKTDKLKGRIVDVYKAGMPEPVIKAKDFLAGKYRTAEGTVIEKWEDIKGHIYDEEGNIVMTWEDFQNGIVKIGNKPEIVSKVSWIKSKMPDKKTLLHYAAGAAVAGPLGVMAVGAWKLAKKFGVVDYAKDKIKGMNKVQTDVYVKGEDTPRLYAIHFKDDYYYDTVKEDFIHYADDVVNPVVAADAPGKIILSKEDIEKGLVDYKGEPIASLKMTSKIKGRVTKTLEFAKNTAKLLGQAAFGVAKFGVKMGIGAVKLGWRTVMGAANLVGRGLGFAGGKFSSVYEKLKNKLTDPEDTLFASLGLTNQTNWYLHHILRLLDKRIPKPNAGVLGDVDGDGVREGGMKDNRRKRLEEVKEKIQEKKQAIRDSRLAKMIAGALTGDKKEKKEGLLSQLGGWLLAGLGTLFGKFTGTIVKLFGWIMGLRGKGLGALAGAAGGLGGFDTDKLKGHLGRGKNPRYGDKMGELLDKDSDEKLADVDYSIDGLEREEKKSRRERLKERARGLKEKGADRARGLKDRAKNSKVGRFGSKVGGAASAVGSAAKTTGSILAAAPGVIGRGLGVAGLLYSGASLAGNIAEGDLLGMTGDAIGLGVSAATSGISLAGISGAIGAAGGIGGMASAAGGALATAGSFLLTNPIGWAIAGTALAGYGAYKLYGWFKNKGNTKINDYVKARLMLYGFNPDSDKDAAEKVLSFENLLADALVFKGVAAQIDQSKLDPDEIMDVFGFKKNDREAIQNWQIWYKYRFEPTFLKVMEVLKGVNGSTNIGDVYNFKSPEALRYLKAIKPAVPRESPSPFKDHQITMEASAAVSAVDKMIKDLEANPETKLGAKAGEITNNAAKLNQEAKEIGGGKIGDGRQPAETGFWGTLKGMAKKAYELSPIGLANTLALKAADATTNFFKSLFGSSKIESSNTISDMAAIGSGTYNPFLSIRFKAYGLNDLTQTDRVSSLMRLEGKIKEHVRISGLKATFNGDLARFATDTYPFFGIADNDLHGLEAYGNYLESRFIPAYLAMVSAARTHTSSTDPSSLTAARPAIQMQVATEMANAEGKNGSIWSYGVAPWGGRLNTNRSSIDKDIEELKKLVEQKGSSDAKTKAMEVAAKATTAGSILDKVASGFGSVKDALGNILDKTKNNAINVFNNVKDGAVNAYNFVKDGVSNVLTKTKDNFYNAMPESVQTAMSNAGGFIDFGKATVGAAKESIVQGVTGKLSGNRQSYRDAIWQVMAKHGITSKNEVAAFLSQIAVETGNLKWVEELASGAAYNGRKDLGNTQPGDGPRFKGRGLIQLTGRANYERFAKSIGRPDILQNPQLVSQDPVLAVESAIFYWKTRKGLRQAAQAGDIVKVSKLVNGGTNHLKERVANFQSYLNGKGPLWDAEKAKTVMSGGQLASSQPATSGGSSAASAATGLTKVAGSSGSSKTNMYSMDAGVMNSMPNNSNTVSDSGNKVVNMSMPNVATGGRGGYAGTVGNVASGANSGAGRQVSKRAYNAGKWAAQTYKTGYGVVHNVCGQQVGKGFCARGVKWALIKGGGYTNYVGPGSAKDAGPCLEKIGFVKVDSGTLPGKNPTDVRDGDIIVFSNKGVSGNGGGAIHGHIQIYFGGTWYSDFKQRTNDFRPGNKYGAAGPTPWVQYRDTGGEQVNGGVGGTDMVGDTQADTGTGVESQPGSGVTAGATSGSTTPVKATAAVPSLKSFTAADYAAGIAARNGDVSALNQTISMEEFKKSQNAPNNTKTIVETSLAATKEARDEFAKKMESTTALDKALTVSKQNLSKTEAKQVVETSKEATQTAMQESKESNRVNEEILKENKKQTRLLTDILDALRNKNQSTQTQEQQQKNIAQQRVSYAPEIKRQNESKGAPVNLAKGST